jgi:predicted lysophospholipase L1 biosynthesis ABC-type transport system permease subunit
VGYPIYGTLLGGAIVGLGVGALAPFRAQKSLAEALPRMQARLAWSALALALAFTLIVGVWMLLSPLKL